MPSAESPMPMYSGAFWIAVGSRVSAITWPKKAISASSGRPSMRGGCRISQSAPARSASPAKATCSATLLPNTVIASGMRPARSAATQARICRRSSGVSFSTSVARPRAASPWAPAATQCSTWRRMAARSSAPSAPKKA